VVRLTFYSIAAALQLCISATSFPAISVSRLLACSDDADQQNEAVNVPDNAGVQNRTMLHGSSRKKALAVPGTVHGDAILLLRPYFGDDHLVVFKACETGVDLL
jgi:hypothetical protein